MIKLLHKSFFSCLVFQKVSSAAWYFEKYSGIKEADADLKEQTEEIFILS